MAPPTDAPLRLEVRSLFSTVYSQAFGLCVAYLVVGLTAELLRRSGFALGLSTQRFLDGLPYVALKTVGLLDDFLLSVGQSDLGPFWSRLALVAIALAVIVAQATLVGLTVLAFLRAARRLAR